MIKGFEYIYIVHVYAYVWDIQIHSGPFMHTLKEMDCSNTKLFLEQEENIRKEENRPEQQRIQSERQFQMQMFEMQCLVSIFRQILEMIHVNLSLGNQLPVAVVMQLKIVETNLISLRCRMRFIALTRTKTHTITCI